jgi:hypothetical protein
MLCNGITQTFPFPFYVNDETDVRVVLRELATGVETRLVLNTDFVVAGVGSQSGGSISTVALYPSGYSITPIRGSDYLQETDLQNQGAYFSQVVEDALDRTVMMVQRLLDVYQRTVHLFDSDVDGVDGRHNANGNKIVNLKAGVDNEDAVNVAQMNAAILAGGGGGGGPGPIVPPPVSTGNVPPPTAAQVGFYLQATAANLWGWVAIPLHTVASIIDATSQGKQILLSTYAQMKVLLGLDQVNNTSDVNKPISTATANALATKLNTSSYVAGLGAATQSQMEAHAVYTVAATPGNTIFHPGVAKFFCNISGYPAAAVYSSFNISSIVAQPGLTALQVNIGSDLSNTGYAVLATINESAGQPTVSISSKTVGGFIITEKNAAGASAVVAGPFSIVGYGDFA